ncbi:hypothetical protein POVWA2_042120 [Plasmodium ovale wallikeri]|uniref:Uncharacterized protein n=1 Tax=Plasmodium ovale wallikeri TaxID=864142 RepID=A0A1A8ZBU8_PLAOA|nr:hypothetical protein POVWA1_043650 [Plasmodium ovale wallikeri]SBT41587.1 hypothetical protein POVWA2_042120 [Plasmodium ovale wallikeri]
MLTNCLDFIRSALLNMSYLPLYPFTNLPMTLFISLTTYTYACINDTHTQHPSMLFQIPFPPHCAGSSFQSVISALAIPP